MTKQELLNQKVSQKTANTLLKICQDWHLEQTTRFTAGEEMEDEPQYIKFLDAVRCGIESAISFNRLTKLGLRPMKEIVEMVEQCI